MTPRPDPKTVHENLHKALEKSYQAIAFDVDGTLTPFAQFKIPPSLEKTLVQIPSQIPRAICSGRDLKFVTQKVQKISENAAEPGQEFQRWALFTENGAEAYVWDPKANKHRRLFEVKWPDAVIRAQDLAAYLTKEFSRATEVLIRDHTLVLRHHDWIYVSARFTRFYSNRVHKKLHKLFEERGLSAHFSIQDSGIGNVILPAAAGKGQAVQKWAQHLGIPVETVVVVGDQPGPGGNDQSFLSGENGTAFSVGALTPNPWPLPVRGAHGRYLKGPEGTETLLSQLKWAESA